MPGADAAAVERAYRESSGRGFAVAAERWPATGCRPTDRLRLIFTCCHCHHLYHSTRVDLLRRLGRREEASAAYGAAIARTANRAERAFLQQRRDSLRLS